MIGLQVEPHAGPSFILPIAFESARDIAFMILQTLMAAAPEMLFPEPVADKYKAGQLSVEQLLEAI